MLRYYHHYPKPTATSGEGATHFTVGIHSDVDAAGSGPCCDIQADDTIRRDDEWTPDDRDSCAVAGDTDTIHVDHLLQFGGVGDGTFLGKPCEFPNHGAGFRPIACPQQSWQGHGDDQTKNSRHNHQLDQREASGLTGGVDPTALTKATQQFQLQLGRDPSSGRHGQEAASLNGLTMQQARGRLKARIQGNSGVVSTAYQQDNPAAMGRECRQCLQGVLLSLAELVVLVTNAGPAVVLRDGVPPRSAGSRKNPPSGLEGYMCLQFACQGQCGGDNGTDQKLR